MVVRLLALASFCLMLWSMLALANRALSSGGSSEDHRRAVTLITLIFVSANYVIQNFLTRSAGPETMAYAAIPLAILLILERRILAASCLIALQISLHPVIGPQIIVATFLLSVLLEWPQMLRPWHYFVVLVAALSLSAPFWLIPWLERDAIQGVAALPVRFSETFLSPLTLLDAILKILDQFYYYCQLFFF
jgi:hypothetical protein